MERSGPLTGTIYIGTMVLVVPESFSNYFEMETKYPRLTESGSSPFIDPESHKKYLAEKEQAFRTELAKQRAALRVRRQ